MPRRPPSVRISPDLSRIFLHAQTRRARKGHVCDSCGGAIDARELYLDTGEVKLWPTNYRYCEACAGLTDAERQERFRGWREKQRAECSS